VSIKERRGSWRKGKLSLSKKEEKIEGCGRRNSPRKGKRVFFTRERRVRKKKMLTQPRKVEKRGLLRGRVRGEGGGLTIPGGEAKENSFSAGMAEEKKA